ncbi:hypothetical protein [Streptomyces pini]|uniref:Uncharacterized protein n=1 Tax=Streptomyces pini TaxID=1520580 RepID=A0A1I4C612_9ACTN|nr:hypothetical protein [Streptomyces pini]SFK76568.1 hypothetical protein SAMN05192584_108273 [Streptomyces pini]
MSGWTPSQAEGERDDEEGIDQSRGLHERHEAEAATRKGAARKAAGAGEKGPAATPSQAEGGKGAEGAEQDRGGAR